jgi:hypothetical protein
MRSLLALSLIASGCNQGDGLVVVTVGATPTVANVASLHVKATAGGMTREIDVAPVASTIPPEVTFGIVVPLSVGSTLAVQVQARDGAGGDLADGSGMSGVSAGGRTDLTVTLGSGSPDGGLDFGLQDGGATDLSPDASAPSVPRQIAPLSTSRVTSYRPKLRWQLPAGLSGAQVDLCASRACTTMLASATVDAAGTSAVPSANLAAGPVFWRVRATSSSGPVTSPIWQFWVGARASNVDTSWGSVLDVNGDGIADLAVAAAGANNGNGRVYVFHGAANLPTGPAQASTVLIGSDGNSTYFGRPTCAGDVNGDGYADLVVGESQFNGGTGRFYLYYGGASGLHSQPDFHADGSDGNQAGFATAPATAGDVNGDGYADVLIPADGAAAGAGRVYVYFGSASGLQATPMLLSAPDGTGSAFGWSVVSTDVNGDGLGDIAVGAIGAATNGRTYLYLGTATGLSQTAININAPDANGAFGIAIANGDANGDGFADLLIGANTAGPNGEGRAYLYYGSASGLAATPVTTLTGPGGAGTYFGGGVSLPDVNADGFGDLLIGANADTNTGKAYVYLGAAAGPSTTPTVLPGPDPNGGFGVPCRSVDDVNGDGFGDIAIASPQSGSSLGKLLVYPGGPGGVSSLGSLVMTGVDTGGSFSTAFAGE